jgi:hypothetical protein
MISRQQLIDQIKRKKSFLCVGLDPDIDKIPAFLKEYPDPIFEFNKRIIDATKDLCIAYKPNAAFYERYGLKGYQSLIATENYLPAETLNIIDAKRGDIGNTSAMYAKAFFDKDVTGMSFDAITVAPYMGSDSVLPFLEFEGKWVILLALRNCHSKSQHLGRCRPHHVRSRGHQKHRVYQHPQICARQLFVGAGSRRARRKFTGSVQIRHHQRLRPDRKCVPFYHLRKQWRGLCRSCPCRGFKNAAGNGSGVGKGRNNIKCCQ